MTLPLSRTEEAMLERLFAAFKAEYVEATSRGRVGPLVMTVLLAETGGGLSTARDANISNELKVRVWGPLPDVRQSSGRTR